MKNTAPIHHNIPTFCAIALFLLNIFGWATADLWYDEVLTLRLFVLPKESLGAIFRDYCIANNHFLNSAIAWLWLKLPFVNIGSELSLRLPSILFACGTLLIIALYWQKWVGAKLANMMAFLFALSPVFAAFAYQLRGYSLAMFLATAAVSAAYARHLRTSWRNGSALFIFSLLLPFTMPSAGMVGGALTIALFFGHDWRLFSWANIRRALPCFLGTALGCAYYLTIWEQFQYARIDAGGWTSGIEAFCHIVGPFALHLGVFLAGFLTLACKRLRIQTNETDKSARFAWFLTCASLLIIVALLSLPSASGRVPFPRVFLVLLPIFSFAAALLAHHSKLELLSSRALFAAVALPAVVIILTTNAINRYMLSHRMTPPQNLLVQYYRGQSPASALLYRLQQLQENDTIPAEPQIVVSPYDAPAIEYYWLLSGREISYRNGTHAILQSTRLNGALPAHKRVYFYLRRPEAAELSAHYKFTLIESIDNHVLLYATL